MGDRILRTGLSSADVDRLVRYYASHWKKPRVILIGYSQGADVLPFALNRLPPATRAMVSDTVLMALGTNASFEFHLGNWVGSGDGDALPIEPETRALDPARISAHPLFPPSRARPPERAGLP